MLLATGGLLLGKDNCVDGGARKERFTALSIGLVTTWTRKEARRGLKPLSKVTEGMEWIRRKTWANISPF